MINNHSKGFTLVEIVVSITLLVSAVTLALSGYIYSLKSMYIHDTQTELDMDVHLTMERLKADIRLSSLDMIHVYPDDGIGPFVAISFPIARDSDGDGIVEKDENGMLEWDETVIYHIREGAPDKLVRTIFSPRDNTITKADRQLQLDLVVENGNGNDEQIPNADAASSRVLFENLLNWKIETIEGKYDAYADIDGIKPENAQLGYVLLDTGTHDFTFKIVGKNSNSSGYKMGIDKLVVSQAGQREGEAQVSVAENMQGASVSSKFSGGFSCQHYLDFPAQAVGDEFTLTLSNDRWEETYFSGDDYKAEDTIVESMESLSPDNYYAVRLAGMDDVWTAVAQTGDLAPTAGAALKNSIVRVLLKGSGIEDNGEWIDHDAQRCRITFAASHQESFGISDVYIGESVSETDERLIRFNTKIPGVFTDSDGTLSTSITITNGARKTTEWIDLPIDKTKNYVIEYRIADDSDNDSPLLWQDLNAQGLGTPFCTAIATVDSSQTSTPLETLANSSSWEGYNGVAGITINSAVPYIPGIEALFANYSPSGTFTSHIFDTHLTAPEYQEIKWSEEVPSGTALTLKVRSSNDPDMAGATDWESITPFGDTPNPKPLSIPLNRYVQFQVQMVSDSNGDKTPLLKDVVINWNGEVSLINIAGAFTKGRDYGTFSLSVDGTPLRSALVIDLEIYKDIISMTKKTQRIMSQQRMELSPRNSNL